MFFHREDINWFKRIELRTKYGRRGHIKEALGTHGHMKCVFNGQLKSQDTILMNLYKRVFPKWTYEPFLLTESEHEDQSMNVD
ncbi:Pre-rRNA-processing protein TSR1 homolog [Anthophora plagiata]